MTMASIVASPGLPDLLNNGLHARTDGTLLRSQMSTSSPSVKVVTRATNVRTSLPTPEPDTTDKPVSDLALAQTHYSIAYLAITWKI
jgi:hypothetical protein